MRPTPIERWEATSDTNRWRRSLPHGGTMPSTMTSPATALTHMGELGSLRDYAQNIAAATGILTLGDLQLRVALRWCCGVGFLSLSLVDDGWLLRCISGSKERSYNLLVTSSCSSLAPIALKDGGNHSTKRVRVRRVLVFCG
jgi:hypothetical protein